MLFLVITAMPTILPSLGDCSSALSHSAFSWFGHIHFTDAYMMDCTEVVVQKAYSEEEIYTEVYTALIERKDAASVLEVFCNEVPLQNYGLNHLKRIQPLDRNDRSGPLQIVVCPVQRFDEVPQRIRDVCTNKRTVKVCSIAPACRQEFEAWNQCWPINFHASHLEKEREKGLSKEDIEQVQIASQHLAEDELLHKWGGALMINPDNGKVVATAAEALSKLVQKAQSAAREWDESACTTVYTPTMLCIEGVAAVVRGDNAVRGNALSSNAYLCSGLDLYLTHEPDLMAAMALVHSRIRRVFFKHADPKMGALLSGRGHIHCLRSLNHNYRVFQLSPKAGTAAVASVSAEDKRSLPEPSDSNTVAKHS